MEYNSTRDKLIIPEYGRNVQKLIAYAISIEDREKRNKVAKLIIRVMGQINPHLRDIADFNHKLWDHLFIISDFKLDVDSPYSIPNRESFEYKPEKLKYSNKKFLFKHYGRNIEQMIEHVTSLEEGEKKEKLIKVIANHLKKSYLMWNRDSVEDSLIIEHLEVMSKGQLKLSPEFKFQSSNEILAKSKSNLGIRGQNNQSNRNQKNKRSRIKMSGEGGNNKNNNQRTSNKNQRQGNFFQPSKKK